MSPFNCLILQKNRSAKREQVLYHQNRQLNQVALRVSPPRGGWSTCLVNSLTKEQLIYQVTLSSCFHPGHSPHATSFTRCFASLEEELMQRSDLASSCCTRWWLRCKPQPSFSILCCSLPEIQRSSVRKRASYGKRKTGREL